MANLDGKRNIDNTLKLRMKIKVRCNAFLRNKWI